VGHPIKGTLLLVGPDGAGKSSVVERLEARAASEGMTVLRVHSRPGLLGGRHSAGPVTEPHADPPRSTLVSVAKVAMIFADHQMARVRWWLRPPAAVVLIERGWYDMAVDPRRYRLPMSVGRLTAVVGRLVPRADVVALLTADPVAIAERKRELPSAEIERQLRRWRELLPRAGRRATSVDTGATTPDQCADIIWAELSRRRWQRAIPSPRRLDLRTTGRPRSSFAVYRPQNRRAKIASVVTRLGASAGVGFHVPPPVEHLDELLGSLGVVPTGQVAMRSSTAQRWVISVDSEGCDIVLKIGVGEDEALRNEAGFLAALHGAVGFQVPHLVWAGPWQDRFVIATRAVAALRSPVGLDEIASICTALVRGECTGVSVIHGDMAPWNLLRGESGIVLLDWESARRRRAPLWDLAHYVTQAGALVGRHSPEAAVSLLVGPGSVGRRHLEEVGEEDADPVDFLRAYLADTRPSEDRARRYLAELRRLTTGGGTA
jgi:thymidylate kinase